MKTARYSRRQVLTTGLGGAASLLLIPGRSAAALVRNRNSLHVVAHADDSILFLNPDEQHDIARGDPVRAVFVTAGESALGVTDPYWMDREAGALAAFAHMAGMADTWSTGTLVANGHALVLNTLTGNPNVSVVFMRLPDGNANGTGFPASNNESLQSRGHRRFPPSTPLTVRPATPERT